jgi:hypothetical protein
MDFVGPCYLNGPVRFYSLNSVDLTTGRCAVTPTLAKAGQHTIDAIWSNWCRLGYRSINRWTTNRSSTAVGATRVEWEV